MADPQLTPEQMQRLVEQQKKFNEEALKTEGILSSLAAILKDEAKYLETSSKKARALNTAIGQGKNITKELNAEILKSGQRIEELEFQRSKNLALMAKARKKEDIEALVNANRKIDAQLKIENSIRGQLELLDQHIKNEEKLSEEKRKQNNLGENAKKYYNDNIAKQFTLLGILKLIFDAAVRFNKVSVEIGKNLGYGADQANRVANNLTTMARNSDNLNFTLANAAEAMNGLASATGLVAEYSADTLETQIMLTKQFGLTEEEAAGIYKFSVLTGQAASKVNDEMVGAFVAARNSFKVGANFRQVMAEAAKVSGQLAANLGYNPERITKAVVAMKAFGTTLEQTKNQGEALLNFESSIESELQAELITGQKLNLERAREAALMGDQVKLAEELTNQGMTLEKFQSMNVIAQKSYAEALGLSADQLSEQLQKQKLAIESGKSLAQLTKEEAIEAEKRQNIQDKFNAAILKLQDFVGGLVSGPFGALLDVLTQALDIVNLIIAPFKLIYDLTSYIGNSIGGLIDKLGVVGKILKGLAGIAIIYAAYKAYASLAALPVIGVGLGAAAAAAVTAAGFGLLNSQKFAKGGIVTSEINNATVGEAGPEAIIPLNSPKADKMLGGGSMDLTPMIAAINEVRNAVNNLASKSSDVVLDGQKVGKQLGTVKALGTSQVQNSYKLA
jgi:biotin operon repressor